MLSKDQYPHSNNNIFLFIMYFILSLLKLPYLTSKDYSPFYWLSFLLMSLRCYDNLFESYDFYGEKQFENSLFICSW